MATKIDTDELTETTVENFIGFMKFVAKNDLWDEAQASLSAAGIDTLRVSSRPIRAFRKYIDDELIAKQRLNDAGHKHAVVISECGCGMGNPGPGHGPVSPHGGGDAGSDASTLPQ